MKTPTNTQSIADDTVAGATNGLARTADCLLLVSYGGAV
jgi:hypothetical protein